MTVVCDGVTSSILPGKKSGFYSLKFNIKKKQFTFSLRFKWVSGFRVVLHLNVQNFVCKKNKILEVTIQPVKQMMMEFLSAVSDRNHLIFVVWIYEFVLKFDATTGKGVKI